MAMSARTWIAALAASLLWSQAAKAAEIPLDEPGFTKTLAKLFRKALPDRHLRVAGALTLKMTGDGQPNVTIQLDNIYAFCTRDPANCDTAVAQHVTKITASYQGLPEAEPKLLRALIRPAAYVDNIRKMYAGKGEPPVAPFIGDLWIVCALDMPQAIEVLKPGDLAKLGMSLDEAIKIAIKNDEAILAPIEQASVVLPHLHLISNNPYDSSRLLLVQSWATLVQTNGGQLLVAAPSVDAVIYADGREPNALQAMREGAAILAQHAQRPLSQTIFRWTPVGWVVAEK
jgi:hypothetical protein